MIERNHINRNSRVDMSVDQFYCLSDKYWEAQWHIDQLYEELQREISAHGCPAE